MASATRSRTRDPRERAELQSRRRFVRRQWARRWLTLKPVLALVALLVVAVAGLYTVYGSDALAAEDVEVTGTSLLTEDEVRAAADVPLGEPLARIDLAAVRARVGSLAAVARVDVTRRWPHDVVVTVTERTPVALLEIAGSLRGLDAEGVVFGTFRPAPPGLPRVRTGGDTSADALREAAQVAGSLPDDLAATVDHLEVETVDQITLVLRDDRVVRWGSADDSAQKAEVLVALLRQPGREYDVSVPGSPTTAR